MREATKKIHSVSDSMVNAKLGFAMSDERVWAEGLLIFYEVFKFLEEAIDRLRPKNEYFDRFQKVLEGIDRKAAFESDLYFYYGPHWKKTCYQPRSSVSDYIKHLKTLEAREPLRLLAYIYHLYMGLLSGGQIIKRKRDIKTKITKGATNIFGFVIPSCVLNRAFNITSSTSKSGHQGNAATDIRIEGRSISSIKKDIVFTMNDISADLSKDERVSLIDESILVFTWNNKVVSTIQVSWFDAFRNVATNPFVAFILLGLLGSMWYLLFLRWVEP
ncbi:unnamed protein product [Allacma fusca]|uniref:Heme oxygenase n=1 Tax=Allacma fusca TaxID=39272 RepID=A0A8J2JWW7_9HEXA|nr:unnamed protein product [Allacma fusca]